MPGMMALLTDPPLVAILVPELAMEAGVMLELLPVPLVDGAATAAMVDMVPDGEELLDTAAGAVMEATEDSVAMAASAGETTDNITKNKW